MTSILITGDFCPQNRIVELLDTDKIEGCFEDVKPVITGTSVSIVNFECPVTCGDEQAIDKCGPNLHSPAKGLDLIKSLGFNIITLANNHIMDYGELGMKRTLETSEKVGLLSVGGGMDLEQASKVLYTNIGEYKIAVINCCEHEFSIAKDKKAGANPLNPIQQYYQIRMAKENADFVLVIVHGGHEHYQLPSPRMQESYRFFIDAGADIVVNHHQHCYSGYEVYKDCPIFYGLGNFCFDWPGRTKGIWNEGFMLKLKIDRGHSIGWELYPYYQCGEKPEVMLMQGKDKDGFYKRIEKLNQIIGSPSLLRSELKKWMADQIVETNLLFQPYNNRFMKALYRRNLLPSFMTKEKKLKLINSLNCEAHVDVLRDNIEMF